MPAKWKKKYKYIRREFRAELYQEMKLNRSLAVLTVTTYAAYKHRMHIAKIWELLGNGRYPAANRAYNKKLFGKHLCGDENIFKSFYLANPYLHGKFFNKIPKRIALGDALNVAYQILKKEY